MKKYFEEGKEAFWSGVGYSHYPKAYKGNPGAVMQWKAGWKEAEEEANLLATSESFDESFNEVFNVQN